MSSSNHLVEGSSPLARGLQPFKHFLGHGPGIIPARAGFTPQAPAPRPRPGDHPRSRGVYEHNPPGWSQRGGSSPLARGLPGTRLLPASRGGIIPARAGFTFAASLNVRHNWDHPRSRGVYADHVRSLLTTMGSSPLARGLLGVVADKAALAADHPRSRGVYRGGTRAARPALGSSPLARGLLPLNQNAGTGAGIIPARAGFTLLLMVRLF